MAGIEEAFEKFVTRVSSGEEPQSEYGDPQTGEKRIPLMQGIKRGYDFENTMPNYYNQRYGYENEMPIYNNDRYSIPQQELAEGGSATGNFGLTGITAIGPTKVLSKPTQQEIDDFVNRPIAMGQLIGPDALPNETYQDYVRRKRRETGFGLQSAYIGLSPTSVEPIMPPTQTETKINTNPIAKALEMAGFTKEEIMRILGQQGLAYGGRVSMSDGGLTTTVPPAKGPDSQGVESLFRRRYI
jgi:hypothetical protein